MRLTGNVRYIPAGTTQYVVDGNDGEINVDTSISAVTIILPNIVNSGYANTDKGFVINDISSNAGTNNITIVASNNTVNSQSSITISVNGGTAKCSIASMNEWFAVTEPSSSSGNISGNLTPNYIPKAQSTSAINDSVIYQNGTSIGIGTINPQTKLQVSGTNGLALITSARYSSDANGAGFVGAKARGTESAPTAVLSGDSMLTVNAYGYQSGGAFSTSIGKMVFYATENFTATGQGTAFKISTTPIGATVDVFNFGINANGDVSIGDPALSSTSRLYVKGINATNSRYALTVENLASVSLLSLRNDGFATILDMNIGRGGGLVSTNTIFGVSALAGNSASGGQNTGIGYAVLNTLSTGPSNTAIGYAVMANITTGTTNVGIGAGTMQAANPSYSIGIGGGVLYQSSGTGNTGIGHGNFYNLSSGNYNTSLGYNAGAALVHTTGTNNVFIGYMADVSVDSLTNAIAIGANATVGASNSMVLGSGVNVGIGISVPTAKLYVTGSNTSSATYALKIDNSTPAALFYIKNNGGISAPLLPTSNAGLSSGDLYVDTAANILANSDKIVGWKV